MILFAIGATMFTGSVYRMAYLWVVRPWLYCPNCDWLTKDESGNCAGCGRENK